jgi:hypothetical protein
MGHVPVSGADLGRAIRQLRHAQRLSIESLCVRGGRAVWVAKQAGHSVAVLFSTYAHLIDEYAERERVDPEREIAEAREQQASTPAARKTARGAI